MMRHETYPRHDSDVLWPGHSPVKHYVITVFAGLENDKTSKSKLFLRPHSPLPHCLEGCVVDIQLDGVSVRIGDDGVTEIQLRFLSIDLQNRILRGAQEIAGQTPR